jgi:hypothetical protein
MFLIKSAIGQVLAENKDRWLGRNQIEEALGLWSQYGSGTYGAVASMFLDELVEEGEVVSQRDPDGRTWLYRTVAAAT